MSATVSSGAELTFANGSLADRHRPFSRRLKSNSADAGGARSGLQRQCLLHCSWLSRLCALLLYCTCLQQRQRIHWHCRPSKTKYQKAGYKCLVVMAIGHAILLITPSPHSCQDLAHMIQPPRACPAD